MEKGVELIMHKNKTIPQEVMKCIKCGKTVVSSEEYERIRKELYPSMISRIKNLFRTDIKFVDIFKGKVL